MAKGASHHRHLLRHLCGTKPFAEYCARRGIPLGRAPGGRTGKPALRQWERALARLPRRRRLRVEREFDRVQEMASPDALRHLVEAAGGGRLPPETVPENAALALWFLLHRPGLFREVFFHHERCDDCPWRQARGPAGLALTDLPARSAALARSLRAFFRAREGAGRFCAVDAYRHAESVCFDARVSGRLYTAEGFTPGGRPTLRRLRPVIRVRFAYRPADGAILLRSRVRGHQQSRELFRRFGRAVLRADLGEDCLGDAFALDVLKGDFSPPPNAPDLEAVRVQSRHLRQPGRLGRRWVKLETPGGDGPSSIPGLLRTHAGDVRDLGRLRVCRADLRVTLREEGRPRSLLVRLWPDGSSLGPGPVGDRMLACLRRWCLCHGRRQ